MLSALYLQDETYRQVIQQLEQQGSLQLQNFLTPEAHHKVSRQIFQLHYQRSYQPQFHSYGSALIDNALIRHLTGWVHALFPATQMHPVHAYRFQHRDYVLFHDSRHEERGIVGMFELTPLWCEGWGGWTLALKGKQEPLRLPSLPNTLTLIRTDEQTRLGVKYINHYAGEHRRHFLQFFLGLPQE